MFASSTSELGGSAALWQKFPYVELTENMRQGEDKKYAELLSIIDDAEKTLSDEDCALIESRFVAKNNLVVPPEVPRLYHRNDDKDKYNMQLLLRADIRNIFRLYAPYGVLLPYGVLCCFIHKGGLRPGIARGDLIERINEVSHSDTTRSRGGKLVLSVAVVRNRSPTHCLLVA